MKFTIAQLTPRGKVIVKHSPYPFFVSLKGTLLREAFGGRSGRVRVKAGTAVYAKQLPSQEWIISEVADAMMGMCRKSGHPLVVDVDFSVEAGQ